MKRMLIFVPLLLVTLSLSADDLLNCSTRALWGERGDTQQFVINAPYIYAADVHGVSVYDASTPALLHRSAFIATPSPSVSLALSGNSLLVATQNALLLYQVDGASLTLVGSANTVASKVAGNDSYFATAGNQLQLWRVSGNSLVSVAKRPIEHPLDVVFEGSRLFVSEKEAGVSIFDTSAGTLAFVSRVALFANAIAPAGNRLYLASGGDGIYAVDLTQADKPRLLGSVGGGAMDATSIAISGNRIFAGSQGRNLVLLQTTESGPPVIVSTTPEPTRTIATDGRLLATAGIALDKYGLPTGSGSPLRLFDVSFSATPTLVGEVLDYAGPVSGVATDGSFAYVADPPVVRVIDIRRASSPREVASILTEESADHVRINGSMLIAYGRAFVHMIDISDPLHPRYLGVYKTQGIARGGASFSGPYLLEANRASGFHVLDITNPQQPIFMTGLKNDTHGAWDDIVGIPGYAYGSVRWGIKIVDLTTNIHHAVWTSIVRANDLHDLEIAPPNSRHGYVLLAFDNNRLRFFDLTDPLHPSEYPSVTLFDGGDVSLDTNDIAYAVSLDGRIARIDFSNLAQPTVTQMASGLTQPRSVAVAGDRVVVGDTSSLRILDDLSKAGVAPPTPTLALTRLSRGLAHVEWNGKDGDRFEVATSSDESFDGASSTFTESNAIDLPATAKMFVRVRALGSCATSDWSNVAVIDPQSISPISFVGTGTHLFYSASSTQTFDVPVRNDGDASATVSLASSSTAITSQPVTIAPHSTATVVASLDPSAAGNQLDATLTIDGANAAPFSVRATRLTRTASPTISPEQILVIPGVGTAPGAAGTSWHSDVAILCRGANPCHVEVDYTAYDGSSRDVVALDLAGGEGTVIRDFVGNILGHSNSSGFVVLRSDAAPRILASAETYNAGTNGKYGQTIAAQRIVVASSSRSTAVLGGVAQNDSYRTNVGFVNGGSSPASASVELHDQSGALVATTTVPLAPGASFAFPLSALANNVTGSLSVTAPDSFVSFASRVDQKTGDAIFEYAQRVDTTIKTQAIPIFAAVADPVGSGPGAGGSQWRTELELQNGATPNHLSMTYVPTADPSAARTVEVDLDPNELLSEDDLFATTFRDVDASLAASGTLRIAGDAPFTGWTNVYNDSAAGRFGQLVPLVDPSKSTHGSGLRVRSLAADEITSDSEQYPQIFPVEETDEARTNVGVAEIAGDAIALRLNVFDVSGALVGTKDVSLGAFQSLRMNGLLEELSLHGSRDLRLEVRPMGGRGNAAAWASTIDAQTGDGAYRMAE